MALWTDEPSAPGDGRNSALTSGKTRQNLGTFAIGDGVRFVPRHIGWFGGAERESRTRRQLIPRKVPVPIGIRT